MEGERRKKAIKILLLSAILTVATKLEVWIHEVIK